MARLPFPVAFPAEKAPATIRIFVLGESAAYGDPQPEFGLSRMLEALLGGKFPESRFEVVNTAITAINSHALLPLAKDCASQQPDALVLYMGNNEVVGPFGAGTVFGSPRASLGLIRANLALKTLRTGQLLDSLVSRLRSGADTNREWGGMAMFMAHQVRQDAPEMRGVYEHFARNLGDILNEGHRHGVKLAVGTVASNLRDCAPFASLHRSDLPDSALADWERLFQQARAAEQAGRPAEACDFFREASRIDDSFADLQFEWGQACLSSGKKDEAVAHLVRARDADALRFRADTRLNEIVRREAAKREAEGIGLVDAERVLAAQSRNSLPGDELFYEHVHLTFEGNYELAVAFGDELCRLLPSLSGQGAWPSIGECAKRLGYTDWHRYQARSEVLSRISDAPFTGQSNHHQQLEKALSRLEALRPATSVSGLRSAVQQCEAAVAQNKNDWILEKELALISERLGDYVTAAKSWRAVVGLLPQYSEAWQQLGRAFTGQKQEAEALGAFQHALELEPDSAPALTGMAEILSRQNRQDEALACYEKILRLKPYWSPAQWGLGQVLESLGRTNEAQLHFRLALQNRIHTQAAFKGLGQLCFDKGWLKEAATNFVDALQLEPFDAATEVNLGLTLALLGQHPQAQEHYARALKLDPDLAEAHVRLGFELGRQGDDAAALAHFARAVELKPDLVEARLDLGIALSNQHRLREALDQFRAVLQRSPTNAIALRYMQKLSGNP